MTVTLPPSVLIPSSEKQIEAAFPLLMHDISLDGTIPFQLTNKIRRDPYDIILPENETNSQAGKIIVITGGGTGIGAAAAAVWVRAGAEGVVIAGRRMEKLQETVTRLEGLSKGITKIIAVQTDLTVDSDVRNLFTVVVDTFGRPADVVLANAATVGTPGRCGENGVDSWWSVWEINLKSLYATAHWFIATQPHPKEPVGTLIAVNSGMAGVVKPTSSAYSISKLAGQRLTEYLHAEYPTLRTFAIFPGIVITDLVSQSYAAYAKDHIELTGMVALWLAKPEADFLRGGITSVNWDIEEMIANQEQIIEEQLLKIAWLPVLPACGGRGLNSLSGSSVTSDSS